MKSWEIFEQLRPKIELPKAEWDFEDPKQLEQYRRKVMSFFELNLEDAQEYTTAPEGEYNLSINGEPSVNAEKSFIQVFLKIDGASSDGAPYKTVRHPLFFPKDDDDHEKRNNKALSIKRFVTAFQIPWSRGDLASLAEAIKSCTGNSAWALLKEKEDAQYGSSNEIRKFTGK